MRTTAPFPFSYSLVLRLRGPETVSVDCKRSPCEQPNCNTQKIIHTTRSNSIAVCVSCVCRLRITRCFKNNPHRVKNSLKKQRTAASASSPPSVLHQDLRFSSQSCGKSLDTISRHAAICHRINQIRSLPRVWFICGECVRRLSIRNPHPTNQPFKSPQKQETRERFIRERANFPSATFRRGDG
jgi:hypothetical protein